jgi:hypothetical protein
MPRAQGRAGGAPRIGCAREGIRAVPFLSYSLPPVAGGRVREGGISVAGESYGAGSTKLVFTGH